MPRRLLLTIAALALAASLGGAGCADDASPAIRIGDDTVSHDDLLAELGEWAGNENTQFAVELPVPGSSHAFALGPATSLIGDRILLGLFEQEFERRGLEITEEDRTSSFALIGIDPAQEEELLGSFSDEYRAEYLDRWAKVAAVQRDLDPDEDLQARIRKTAKDVELSPRYGTWDPVGFAVTPPSGPAAASTDADDATVDTSEP